MNSAANNPIPSIFSVLGMYSFLGFIGLLLLRMVLIEILKKYGKFESMGSPRALTLSDLLPFRMLMGVSYLSNIDKAIICSYMILYVSVLLALIATVGYVLAFRT